MKSRYDVRVTFGSFLFPETNVRVVSFRWRWRAHLYAFMHTGSIAGIGWKYCEVLRVRPALHVVRGGKAA